MPNLREGRRGVKAKDDQEKLISKARSLIWYAQLAKDLGGRARDRGTAYSVSKLADQKHLRSLGRHANGDPVSEFIAQDFERFSKRAYALYKHPLWVVLHPTARAIHWIAHLERLGDGVQVQIDARSVEGKFWKEALGDSTLLELMQSHPIDGLTVALVEYRLAVAKELFDEAKTIYGLLEGALAPGLEELRPALGADTEWPLRSAIEGLRTAIRRGDPQAISLELGDPPAVRRLGKRKPKPEIVPDR